MIHDYLVVYVKSKGENGAFMGYSPDVLRCVSTGDSLEEMRAMMKEALEGHLAWMASEGDDIPLPHVNSVEFDPEIWDEVEFYLVEKVKIVIPTIEQHTKIARQAVAA